MKNLMVSVFLLAMFSMAALASGDDFSSAEKLISNKTACSQLSDVQLEAIGDYYMEQMHPGEAHEQMDAMMGGEGSESLRQMHISMAKSFYCGESRAMTAGMMNTMMGRTQMMGGYGLNNKGTNMLYGYGMMGGWPAYSGFSWLWMPVWLAFWIGIIWLVIWLIRNASGKNDDNALETVKKRYARGEISARQYEQMKKELRGKK